MENVDFFSLFQGFGTMVAGGWILAAVSYTHLDVYKRQPKGTSTDITVNVTYKNVTYKTTLSGCTLTAGSQYEYTLTIQNNILVPVGSEIKPWTPNQTHTGSLS